ncbi:MAG: glycosyltransferase family 2 protein [Gammaproteobacteria bacterium]|nr:glycosyltransferase family 2 protein [Gammaproteobacteria bacterium]
MPTLSVILITLNEAERLTTTLEAIAWADEIVVVDAGSTDGTVEIARRFTTKVVITGDWPGFGPQKNRALDMATGEWVLSIDADERVTPELATEIRATLASPRFTVYAIPRLSSFLGRPLRHGGWWPDYVPRLFRRDAARFSEDVVHERLVFTTAMGRLRNPLEHETVRDLDQLLEKLNRYSHAGAERLAQAGKRSTFRGAIGHGLWAFIRTYLLKGGFLDGREGFIMAVATAENAYYKHLKRLYRR